MDGKLYPRESVLPAVGIVCGTAAPLTSVIAVCLFALAIDYVHTYERSPTDSNYHTYHHTSDIVSFLSFVTF
jgi:uncharacterized membrane protein YphA (DoxX/SURF4 family)